jgi:hypothetical protein
MAYVWCSRSNNRMEYALLRGAYSMRSVGRLNIMPRRKRLRSVCHSIAHHAVSGLSYVHPHASPPVET